MKASTKWIIATLATACIIFAFSPGPTHFIANPSYWELREQFVFFTGLSAVLLMTLSVVISVRYPTINKYMLGLDKAYIIHKWTGITATLLALLHWLGEKIPEWLVELGYVANPGELNDGNKFSDLEINLFQAGVFLAEWTFYIIIILVAIALYKKIPYNIFRKSHKIFPYIFIIIAYHAATAQLKEDWLSSPAGYLLLLILTIGIIAAIIGIFQQIGASRKISTTITLIKEYKGIIDITLTSKKTFLTPTRTVRVLKVCPRQRTTSVYHCFIQ